MKCGFIKRTDLNFQFCCLGFRYFNIIKVQNNIFGGCLCLQHLEIVWVQDHKPLLRLALGSYKIDQYISLPIQKEANILA